MLGDLKSHRWIIAKGFMFLLGAAMAGGLIFVDLPSFRTAFLVVVLAWCSARFYYFAFYVLERYIDDQFRFDGLGSALRFAFAKFRESPTRKGDND